MTANAHLLALHVAQHDDSSALLLILVLLSYILGSSYCSFILGNRYFKLGRRYGLPSLTY
ncbi:hypothetical protein [Acinetobacter lanii]|uniref:hypothetical protein n=1 Tax=Acinetobacter lanii TaxID=2715163 RepID=UPI003877EF23